MRGFCISAALVVLTAGCGDHGQHQSWRRSIAPPDATSEAEVSEFEYPPFTEGVFPCSRCHAGGGKENPVLGRPHFAHAIHLEEGIGCEDCHMPDGGNDPAPAKLEFCLECHENPQDGSDGVRAYFESIREGDSGYAIPGHWASDELAMHHPAHAKAGLACDGCHGKPSNAPFVKPRSVPLMEGCVACHNERKVAAQCEICHTRIRDSQHNTILLRHAEDQRDCFGCHNPDNRDVLRLANGTTLRFEDSYLLCGQCHGPKLRDWRLGLHGKRTGEWRGKHKYRLCVHCHSPHEPRYKPMPALPRPARPEEIR